MKLFNTMLAAVAMVLLVGCGDVLDYVPETAAVVAYGNTEAFFDSKIWEIMEKNKFFQKEILPGLKEQLPCKELTDYSGKVAMWFEIEKGEPKPAGAVIIYDNDIAEDVFNRIRKSFQERGKVESVKKDDCEGFELHSGRGVTLSMVLVSDNEIHVTFGDNARIWNSDGDNDIADEIDRDCVVAIATNGESWKSLFGEDKFDFDVTSIGIAKLEAYLTSGEIKVNATVDISDVD